MKSALFVFALTALVAAPANVATAPFGCDARDGRVCYFRIFYERGGRAVVLPAGMKQGIPDVRIGKDSYCVGIGLMPRYKCSRKTINGTYNN